MAFNRASKGSKSLTVEKEGYLWVKRNASIVKSKEKQKYVVLRKSFGDGNCLEWYENFEAFIAHKNSTKLKLDDIDYIGPVDMSKEYTYAFILFAEGQSKLTMAAKNETERGEWIKALNHCLQTGRKPSVTSPNGQSNNNGKTGYPVKLKDYICAASQDILSDSNRDYVMIVGPKCIALISIDVKGEQRLVLSWLLENIKSYESRPLEQNPAQKLLSIDTGRRSLTGQGTFNFFTPYGDQIKNQISQNTKRSYFKKMNSTESFNMDNTCSTSPESTRSYSSSPSRSFSAPVSVPRRATMPSREGPIPFHKYDPPTGSNRDSYAPYIQQPNGYVDIFTDPRKVERSRMRSYSGTPTSRSPSFEDHSAYIDFSNNQSQDSRAGYIQVLPSSESETGNTYIDILPEEISGSYAYLEVLEEEENCHQYIEVLADESSSSVSPKESKVPDDHPAYIEVLGDDETTNQSHGRGISRESSEDQEIYIDVEENRKKSRERRTKMQSESSEEHFESHVEVRLESREESLKTHEISEIHVTSNSLSHHFHEEVHKVQVAQNSFSREVRHEFRQTRESNASSSRWPPSMNSQTSTDMSSISSENDVFNDQRERGMSIPEIPEVFTEESINSDDGPTSSEALPANSEITLVKSGELEIKPNVDSARSDEVGLKVKDDSTKANFLVKPTLVASKSATLPARSEGFPTNSDVKSSDVNETRDERSLTPDHNNRSRARSWHSENGFTSSTSTSESDNTRDSHDCSDEENSDHTEDSSRDSFSGDVRNRSHTTGEVCSLRNNVSMLAAFQAQLTCPQQFPPRQHPPLTREPNLTQDQVIAQLENPILGVSQLLKTTKPSNAVEFKYICAECGWHKKSKKRSSLTPSFRTKQCPICGKPVSKQVAKSPKSKEKSPGNIFNKIIKKSQTRRRNSDEKMDKKDHMKPERPSITAEPLFIKNIRDPAMFGLGRHSPSLDPKRSERGIAPSPKHAFSAVSLNSDSISRGNISCDESNSTQGKNPLATSFSEGFVANDPPLRTVSPTPPLSKSSTTTSGSYLLGRTKSSPPLSSGAESGSTSETLEVQESEKVSRKNSGLTLPTLPEVEDTGDADHQSRHTLVPATPPPLIPPRTREVPPPLPPRRGSSPVAPREDAVRLRRAQTDPTFSLPPLPGSPPVKPKSRVLRTLTDPGMDNTPSDDNIRNAVSLGDLLEDGNEEIQMMKVVSLSLGDEIDSDVPPPPLPPRRGSDQAQSTAAIPRRASNENERLVPSSDSPRIEARNSAEIRRPVLENPAGSASPKLPLSTRRSVDAKKDFQSRKPVFSTTVDEQ